MFKKIILGFSLGIFSSLAFADSEKDNFDISFVTKGGIVKVLKEHVSLIKNNDYTNELSFKEEVSYPSVVWVKETLVEGKPIRETTVELEKIKTGYTIRSKKDKDKNNVLIESCITTLSEILINEKFPKINAPQTKCVSKFYSLNEKVSIE